MKIAIATDNYTRVTGHAGKARHWLLYMLGNHRPEQLLPAPPLIKLAPEQVMHYFKDDAPHPLDGVDLVVAGSAGDGFIRHMRERGADVLLTVPAATKAASAAPGPDALTALAAEEANTVWKLTLLDTADAFRLTQDGASLTANTGSTLSFTYSGFVPGEKRYISAILADNTGKNLYYGQLAKPADESGSVSYNVPMVLQNGTYILKIFAETIDTAKASDVGSQIQTVRLSVGNNLEGAVAVSGTAEYGCALTATVSGDNHLGTLAYQWTRNGAEIAGATDSSYTATADDIGKTLACVVTDTSESESGSHRSNSIVSHGVTVEKRTLTFRADDKSIFTGGALPAYTVCCAGFENGDTQETIVSSLGTAACAADGKTAGTFPITVTGSALSGSGKAQYYRISTVNGVLTVNTPASSSSVTVRSAPTRARQTSPRQSRAARRQSPSRTASLGPSSPTPAAPAP